MGSVNNGEGWRRLASAIWDVALPAGLACALLIVLAVDRMRPKPEKPSVDLVFVLDQGPSMTNLIDPVKTIVLEKAKEYADKGLGCRFAVVPFGGETARIPQIAFTDDWDDFRRQLADAPSAGSWPATAAEALEQATEQAFRSNADPIFMVISESPCGSADEVAEAARKMREKGVTAIVQANADAKEHCLPLYENGGKFFTLDGTDLTGPATRTADAGSDSARSSNILQEAKAQEKKPELPGTMKGLYAMRTAPRRSEYVKQLGGSDKSEEAVRDGMDWLARHQADDGSWSDPRKCEDAQRCPHLTYADSRCAIAETGLAILALQAGGHYDFNDQPYSGNVKRGLDWLVARQANKAKAPSLYYWYEHGIATFALAEACAVARAADREPDKRYLRAAEKAIDFIEDHQYARGGWQYAINGGAMGDTSVTGWQVLALKSAVEAKIPLSRKAKTMARVRGFFEIVGDPETGRTGYQSRGRGTDLTTAVGLIMQGFVFNEPDSPMARKAADDLSGRANDLGRTGDFYTLYNGSLAMFVVRGEPWEVWNRGVRDAVIARQERTGCSRGSWNAQSHSGQGGPYGQTLDTSWALLTLQVYYRYAASREAKPPEANEGANDSEPETKADSTNEEADPSLGPLPPPPPPPAGLDP